MNGSTPTLTKEAIDAYKAARVQECNAAIVKLLEEYGCELQAFPQVTPDGRIVAVLQLAAK